MGVLLVHHYYCKGETIIHYSTEAEKKKFAYINYYYDHFKNLRRKMNEYEFVKHFHSVSCSEKLY